MPCDGPSCRSRQRVTERRDGIKLCDKCEKERRREDAAAESSTEHDPGHVATVSSCSGHIVNELLTYCFHHQKTSSRDAIKRVVLQFYNPEEISAAKVTLWDAYGAEALGATMARQDSLNRAAHEAEIDDIMDVVMKLDAEVDSDVAQVQFVAYDLGRLPRVAPEEMDLTSLVMRITQLEHKHASLENNVAKNVDNITALMDAQFQTAGYAGVTKSHVGHVKPGQVVRASAKSRSIPTSKPSSIREAQQQYPRLPAGTVGSGRDQSADILNDSDGDDDGATSGDRASGDNDGFQLPREQRKRRARDGKKTSREPVYGSNDVTSLRAGKRTRELFVFNLDCDTTEDDLSNFLSNSNIIVSEI